MRILLSAYACDPSRGSEAGGGWAWASQLAQAGHCVHTLTRSVGRENIEAALQARPIPGLSFTYFDGGGAPWPLQGRFGSWYWDYLLWQRRALRIARGLHRAAPFDLVQHVSWGSLHIGSRLWKLGVPFVFGPAGGGQVAPPGFWRYFGSGARPEQLRSLLVRHVSSRCLFGRSTARHADLVFVTNAETAEFARSLGARRVHFLPASGIPENFINEAQDGASRPAGSPVRLVWVGSLHPWKACLLALEIIAEVKRRMAVTLTVIGDGPQRPMLEAAAKRLGIANDVRWTGWVEWREMPTYYRTHDALLFTSLRESCGMQILEGMAQGLPVVGLDHHGARLLVGDGAGIKIPVTAPGATVQGMAEAICSLARDPALRESMRRRAIAIARTHTWPEKVAEALRVLATVPSLEPLLRHEPAAPKRQPGMVPALGVRVT